MIKHIQGILLFLIPFTITYAIVSSVGTTGNHYRAPHPVNVSR